MELARAGSVEPGEQDGRGDFIGLDASGIERYDTVGGAEPNRSVPGRKTGVLGEDAGGNAVVGSETFFLSVREGMPDNVAVGGEPELAAVKGDFPDILVVQDRLDALL